VLTYLPVRLAYESAAKNGMKVFISVRGHITSNASS